MNKEWERLIEQLCLAGHSRQEAIAIVISAKI